MTPCLRWRLPLGLIALTGFGWTAAAQPASAVSPPPAASAGPAVPAQAAPPADASTPMAKTPPNLDRFLEMHRSFLRRGWEAPMGVLFLGDSITELWSRAPDVWAQHYWKYAPANFGISGDTTQNVLWRIENKELDGLRPRVVVLMIGTNNTKPHVDPVARAAEIAAADRKIVDQIRAKIPGVKVLLLAIFPRGPHVKDGVVVEDMVNRMKTIRLVNQELAKLDDGHAVRFLDISAKFFGPDGKIPDSVMPDHLHPSAAGYEIWADAMQPLLDEMMR